MPQITHMFVNSLANHAVVDINSCSNDTDFIILFGREHLDHANEIVCRYPHVPLIVYNWDQYGWHQLQDCNWNLYNSLQEKSKEIWVPSKAVSLRIEEFLKLGNKCFIMKSWARIFDYPKENIIDGRYVFQVVRNYHPDPFYNWAERACSDLNIPLFMNAYHKKSEEEFQKFIAESTLLLCHYDEASTGGLTLIEGHRLGKPVLFCDSPYMGAKDYFGERAHTFRRNDYEDFVSKLRDLYHQPVAHDFDDCHKFTDQYKIENYMIRVKERLMTLKNEIK